MMMSEPRASDVVRETTGHQLLIGLPNENAEAIIIFSWGIIMNLISLNGNVVSSMTVPINLFYREFGL